MPFNDTWLQQDGLMNGRFRFDSRIKDGKFTAVYRMIDNQDNRPWILRVYIGGGDAREAAEFQQTFQQVWARLSQVENARLPKILDAFSLEACTYVLREQVEGSTLLSYIQSGKTIDESQVRDWGGQLCDLLGPLHQHGVVLGIVRPNDVYVLSDGTLRLADYGPMVFWPPSRRPRVIKEWLGGMAPPEALRGQEMRASSDVYAIGSLLHYCLTRIKPRTHSSPFTLLGKHRDDVSRDFNRVIMRCLSFSPDGRFDDLKALKVALLGQAGPMGSAQADSAAKVMVTPHKLIFRDVDPDQVPTQTLTITTTGPDDRATIRSSEAWLIPDPDMFEGALGEVRVTVDPKLLVVGELTAGEVTVYGKKGGHAKVPVEVTVQPQGITKSSKTLFALMQLVLPLLVAVPTFALVQFMHTQAGGDPTFAHYLAQGLAGWLMLQPLLLPMLSLMAFSRMNRMMQSLIFYYYVASLFLPLAVLAAVWAMEGAQYLPPTPVYLVSYWVAWLMGAATFSDFGWINRVPGAAQKAVSVLIRLLFVAAMGAGFWALLQPVASKPSPAPHHNPSPAPKASTKATKPHKKG
ncbi:MAG TPA: protein kinase [Candidatus Xenobia bacterium]|jgi:hypothetical protein